MWELPGFTRAVAPSELFRAGGALFVCAAIGYLFYRLLLARVRRGKALTDWGGDDLILAATHDVVLVWFTLAGAYAGVRSLPFEQNVRQLITRFLLIVAIASATWVVTRLATDSIRLFQLRSGSVGSGSSILINVVRITTVAIGGVLLLQAIGIQVGPLIAAIGVGGLAVALALQDQLRNFFAGLSLLATKKARPGHYVMLDSGEEGYIVDVDWRHTSIRQLPDNMILVPNAKLADAVITNYHYPEPEMGLLVDIGVDYASDLEHVERVTIDVATDVMKEVDGGVPSFEPFMRYKAFADSSIDFTVILRVRDYVSQYLVRHEFLKRLKRRYSDEGIAIPFPVVQLDDRAATRRDT